MADEATTDTLAEIEGQEHELPKGWQVVPLNEELRGGDEYHSGLNRYIRRIEPEPEPEPQPVQIREGRWRTRNGEVRNVTPTPADHSKAGRHAWHDAKYYQTWYPSGRYTLHGDHPLDLVKYLGPIEPEPEKIITPDDVAAEALAGAWDQGKAEQEIAELQAQVRFLKGREVTLGTRLEYEKAVAKKRLQQVEELRSEVSYVQGLLGDERRRFAELETLTSDLRAVNAAQEKAMNSAARENADLQHRLDTVAAEWAQQAEATRRLQIKLDAREQVPEAVSDRFDQGFEHGKARAVETIAEWLEPFRTCGSQSLALAVLQNLPHIMRTLTGLTDKED